MPEERCCNLQGRSPLAQTALATILPLLLHVYEYFFGDYVANNALLPGSPQLDPLFSFFSKNLVT